jgi:hypothetical protein
MAIDRTDIAWNKTALPKRWRVVLHTCSGNAMIIFNQFATIWGNDTGVIMILGFYNPVELHEYQLSTSDIPGSNL